MNLRDVTRKNGRLVVIRHNSAEIWWFKYGLTISIGTLKIMASIGVFVLLVRALIQPNSGHGRQPTIILTQIKHKQSRSYQKTI
jgi:hypothetical protein